MARLTSLLVPLLLASTWLVGQEPVGPLDRLESLLENPKSADVQWRRATWAQLIQLEHGPIDQVLAGWKLLAQNEADRDLANLLIYQRRHGLALDQIHPNEAAESTLERCLALWGAGQLDQARIALKRATELYPTDIRFRDNLLWLDLAAPAKVSLDGDARHLALAVLAAAAPRN